MDLCSTVCLTEASDRLRHTMLMSVFWTGQNLDRFQLTVNLVCLPRRVAGLSHMMLLISTTPAILSNVIHRTRFLCYQVSY